MGKYVGRIFFAEISASQMILAVSRWQKKKKEKKKPSQSNWFPVNLTNKYINIKP